MEVLQRSHIISPKLHQAWVGDALPIGYQTFTANSIYAEKRELSNNHAMSVKILNERTIVFIKKIQQKFAD